VIEYFILLHIWIAFRCEYQCSRLLGKTRLWNDLLCGQMGR